MNTQLFKSNIGSTFPEFCTVPMHFADSCFSSLDEGYVFRQYTRHYLVQMELIEYDLQKDILIDFEFEKPVIMMYCLLEGDTVLYDDQRNLLMSHTSNTCQISAMPAGKYTRYLPKGKHSAFVLFLNAEWIKQMVGRFTLLSELMDHHLQRSNEFFCMPRYPAPKAIVSTIGKWNKSSLMQAFHLDSAIHRLTLSCLKQYCSRHYSRLSNSSYQQGKAAEIASYINRHFADHVVENTATLASKFFVSEKTLMRLARLAFSQPLHKKVIELRLLNGLKLLMTTHRPINEIALLVGYNDAHYFSRAFKRFMGVTPNMISRPWKKI